MSRHVLGRAALTVAITALSIAQLSAQPPAAAPQPGRAGRGAQGPQVVSPEVTPDRRIVFRIVAPQAQAVTLDASDIPAPARASATFTKAENGVWEATAGPVDPGAYRYRFMVDRVATIDPRNPSTSESNANTWSLIYVPGSEISDTPTCRTEP